MRHVYSGAQNLGNECADRAAALVRSGYEPKLIEPEGLEPRRVELDRNLGTDPYQTQERIMGETTNILSPKKRVNEDKLVLRCPTSSHRCIPIMTQRKAL